MTIFVEDDDKYKVIKDEEWKEMAYNNNHMLINLFVI